MLDQDCDDESVRCDSEEDDGDDGGDFLTCIYPYDAALSAWDLLASDVKKTISHKIKIADFWWHILLRKEDKHPTTLWAIMTGFLDSNVKSELSLQKLERIEILESILSAMERGWLSDKLTRQLIPMGACFVLSNEDLTDKAMKWLSKTGEPNIVRKVNNLGPRYICYEVLKFIFSKYSPLTTQAVAGQGVLLKLKDHHSMEPDIWAKEKCEELKSKGNEQYRKNNFRLALKWYTKAIEYHPTNHVLYGNRAICFIRIAKYLKAIGDGKRAMVLKPDWAKGHYRFCEALFLMEQHKKALEANDLAHTLCQADPEGIKDLDRQREKFLLEMDDCKGDGKSGQPKKTEVTKTSQERSPSTLATSTEPQCSAEPVDDLTEEKEVVEDQMRSKGQPGESGIGVQDKDNKVPKDKDNKETKQIKRDVKEKKFPKAEKINMKRRHSPVNKKAGPLKSAATPKEKLCCAVQDAYMALNEEQWFNAKQAFFHALEILDSTSPKKLGISELDKFLLMYGYGTALLEIGQPQELAEATKQFVQIQSGCDGKLEHLVYYGIGRVFLKENRFSEALKQFSEALLLCERKTNPEELTWPTTDVPVKDAQMETLWDFLEESIETCRFPPSPDAICRHTINEDHFKKEIYYTDPGFKGFHRIECSQRCVVEFHTSCWKKFKAIFPDKTDKDFLQKNCFTPDCIGTICHVVIVGSTGCIKCEFESVIPKLAMQRPKVKQRPKVVKIKENRKVKNRQVASVPVENDAVSDQNPSVGESAEKETATAWLEDHVLRKIGEMRASFVDGNLNVSAFKSYLNAWIERDIAKGLGCPTFLGEGLTDVVDMLLQRKNRVWARIFIQELSNFADLKPELHEWAQHLNSQGLESAQTFIERYSESLEELDLGLLLKFPPLQTSFIDSFGIMPDLFSGTELTITECLRQSSPQQMRLFIWTLEEHRDDYPSFHTVLDEYFAMDCSYLVIKKTEHDTPTKQTPKKNRSKRKKPKEPKSVLVLSGMRSGPIRGEREDDYLYEEDSLMLLDDVDPFTVPDYLRDEVAEFEEEVFGTVHDTMIRRFPYHIPDPTSENLYDYFAQVLEEHGPLEANHPLLVGELENFPPNALKKIEESGGLQSFLLQSFKFVIKDDVIALMKQAGILQSVTPISQDLLCYCHVVDFSDVNETILNPFAEEFHPTLSRTRNIAASEDLYNGAFGDNSCQTFSRPIQGCRHPCHLQELRSEISKSSHIPFEISNSAVNISSIKQTGQCSNKLSTSLNGSGDGSNIHQHGMAACNEQVFSSKGDDVAVNTETYDIFENMKGGMTKKEKLYMEFKNKIPLLKKEIESKVQRRNTDTMQRSDVYETVSQQVEIINQELNVLQQKFDEEIKMYQPEKKENQETLKILKAKISSLSASNESVSMDISEENKKYETKQTQFTTIKNQLSAEKNDLKGEIDVYKQRFARQTKRSQLTAVLILESRQEHRLRNLKKFVVRGKAIINRITELSIRHPSSGLEELNESWRACIREAEQRISQTQARYRRQMEMVKNETIRLHELPQVSVPECPPIPSEPIVASQPFKQHPGLRQIYSHHNDSISLTNEQLRLSAEMSTQETKAQNILDRIADHLIRIFPHFDRKTINSFTHKVISSNGGHLSSQSYEEILQRVTQHICDVSENERVSKDQAHSTSNQSSLYSAVWSERSQKESNSYSPMKSSESSLPAWKNEPVKEQSSRRVLNMEDPCIICHEEVLPKNLCVLECRHGFHHECIRSWLSTQSTCPTCRKHIPFSDDFPKLPVRLDRSNM